MQLSLNNNRGVGACMMTIYAIGLLPLSFSRSCSGNGGYDNPFRIETGLASLQSATGWINTPPLSPRELKGKVVLVEFCTYTCINWLRTMPYVRAWSEKYRDNGLVVIGVHTPEFPFESDTANVRKAMTEMKIGFPIAIDNNRQIWDGFDNSYWPALYFIDARGKIRYHQFGEGGYEESEKMIRQLLKEAGAEHVAEGFVPGEGTGIEMGPDLRSLQSAEQYLGYGRSQNFASRGSASHLGRMYEFPSKLRTEQWALSGEWTFTEYSVLSNRDGGKIAKRFHARDLHLVMGPGVAGKEIRFRVLIDGKVSPSAYGGDVDAQGFGVIREQRLYQLIRQQGPVVDREFVIEFLDPGAEAFSFTFG